MWQTLLMPSNGKFYTGANTGFDFRVLRMRGVEERGAKDAEVWGLGRGVPLPS